MTVDVTGYSSVGKTGVEAAYNFLIDVSSLRTAPALSGLMEGKDPKGNDVVLTLDMDIQRAAGDLLGSKKVLLRVMVTLQQDVFWRCRHILTLTPILFPVIGII